MSPARSTVLLAADAEGPRVEGLRRALARFGEPEARVLSYGEVLDDPRRLHEALEAPCWLRLESPGKNEALELALIARGRGTRSFEPPEGALARGRLLAPADFMTGFRSLLSDVGAALAAVPHAVATSHPDDVALFFDKGACAERLGEAGIPVPPPLAHVGDYADLRTKMREAGWTRVFVKLRSGSTASGIVALATRGPDVRARTTIEWVEGPAGPMRFNSRRLVETSDEAHVARLVDWLLAEGAHVERWIPKATLGGMPFDLRVVVVAGRVTHVVVRTSRGPFTNLQLGGKRASFEELRARLGEARWTAIAETCERVAALFPRTLHLGLDVMVPAGLEGHFVLEVNAFGDLLPGLVDASGDSTYDAEVRALVEGRFPSQDRSPCTT